MDLDEAIKRRQCVRKFDVEKDVSDEQVDKLLEAGRWAPSAGNLQSWFFVIVRDEKVKAELAKAAVYQMFIKDAPVVVVCCANTRRSSLRYGRRGKELYAIQDATIAAQNIFLTATSLGLAACWVGAFREGRVQSILSLEKYIRPIAIMPIGYTDVSPKARSRRDVSDISKVI